MSIAATSPALLTNFTAQIINGATQIAFLSQIQLDFTVPL